MGRVLPGGVKFAAGILIGLALGVVANGAMRSDARPLSVGPPVQLAAHPVRPGKVVHDGEPAAAPAARGKSGLRVYYDAVHGARHLWNRDNRRYRTDYHTVSGWYRFVQALGEAGYTVEAESHACFDRASLDDFDVFIIGEQTYHGRFMTDAERTALVDWVRDGGGLFVTVEHTNAHYMGDVFNLLMKEMPVQARFDSICDTVTSDRSSPDWVALPQVVPHPVTEGVRDYWTYNACSLDTPHGVVLSADEAWSDAYDPKDKPVHNGDKKRGADELSGPLAGIAAFEFGKGRVVVISDHNGLSNTELYVGDHHRFAMNAVRWLAHAEDRPELVEWAYPGGYDLFVHIGAGSEMALHKKSDTLGYRTAYATWSREPQLRPWASATLREGAEALLLGAPTVAYTEAELLQIDGYLAAGKPVIWLATLGSLSSAAADQLKARFGFEVRLDPAASSKSRRPLEVSGPPEWTAEIFRVFSRPGTPGVHVEGLAPIVQLGRAAWHVEEKPGTEVLIDLVSAADVGGGRFYVVAPFELFDDRSLPDLTGESADVIRQQSAELLLRLVKNAVGDETILAD